MVHLHNKNYIFIFGGNEEEKELDDAFLIYPGMNYDRDLQIKKYENEIKLLLSRINILQNQNQKSQNKIKALHQNNGFMSRISTLKAGNNEYEDQIRILSNQNNHFKLRTEYPD